MLNCCIHRHTGGLENFINIERGDIVIHRHTGGLETKKAQQHMN